MWSYMSISSCAHSLGIEHLRWAMIDKGKGKLHSLNFFHLIPSLPPALIPIYLSLLIGLLSPNWSPISKSYQSGRSSQDANLIMLLLIPLFFQCLTSWKILHSPRIKFRSLTLVPRPAWHGTCIPCQPQLLLCSPLSSVQSFHLVQHAPSLQGPGTYSSFPLDPSP